MIGIDSNILIYAHNRASPYYDGAKRLIHTVVEKDLLGVSEISLREFYAVITDGRKVDKPLTPENASILLKTYFQSKRVVVCQLTSEAWEKTFEYLVRYKISRYDLDDLLIALTLWLNGIETVYTSNTKDFKKFDFIKAVNPFAEIRNPKSEIRNGFIPYARQSIDEKDVAAVCSVLRSDWLTTGPKVTEFEEACARFVGAKHAVAVSSGTAALHCAMYALGIGPGDEVIVPPMTFASTANCIVFQGGTPVFADVDPDTLLIDPAKVEERITEKTKAIIGVDYAGQPCDWDALSEIAYRHNLRLVDDGCHALGAKYKGKKVGAVADMTAFSFHPVKHITTGEGGMITTDNVDYANRMRIFRNHGITTDHRQREKRGIWFYEMTDIGYNYRMTDFQCALGISQLRKLPKFLERRREIAAIYDEALADISGIEPLGLRADVLPAKESAMLYVNPVEFTEGDSIAHSTGAPCSLPSSHAYHLYAIRLEGANRVKVFKALREEGIGVNVHYIPVYLHPFYRDKFNVEPGLCSNAEAAYEQIISVPMFPGMVDEGVEEVINAVKKAVMQ